MNNEQHFSSFPTQPELLTAIREKITSNRFVLRNAQDKEVASLQWMGFFSRNQAIGSWNGGKITIQNPKWWSTKLTYQVEGDSNIGQLPFEWRHMTHAIDWQQQRFRLKPKGWFLRRFQLFDEQNELLADFQIREKFISFKIDINCETRLYKYKRPEALVLTALYLLYTRLRRARSAA